MLSRKNLTQANKHLLYNSALYKRLCIGCKGPWQDYFFTDIRYG